MIFNNQQISSLQKSVEFHHTLFILQNIGTDILTSADRKLLRQNDIDLSTFKNKIDSVTYSYMFGKLESSVRDRSTLKKLNLEQYKEFITSNPDKFKLTKEDKQNIHTAKMQFYNDIKRLSGDIKSDLQQSLIEINNTFKQKTKSATKQILRTFGKTLAENTKRYSARFEVISGYNMHSSYQQGIAGELLARLGPNAKVYFTTHPDCCPYCAKTYLRNGRGSQPRIFYLKTVIANGSNIGRKAKQYRASLQPLHPRCRCKMNMLPRGKIKWSPRQNRYIRDFS